jgi:hypothetical protein
MIDPLYALIIGVVFYGVLALFTRMSRGEEVESPSVLGPVHLNQNDVTTVAVIDFVTSFVLQRTVPTSVWIASMLVLFALSCAYVSWRANTRYRREVENLHRLFR